MLENRVLHADETPEAMLKPGDSKTHRAHLWSYCTTSYSAVRVVMLTSPTAAAASMRALPRAAGRTRPARHAGMR
jgi:hypothetical protein